MKTLLFLCSLLLLVGCASKPQPVVHIIHRETPTPLSAKDAATVRLGETIKAYPMGRYVDPHNRRIMHEGHTIYRIESTPRWNLHAMPPSHAQRGPSIKAPPAPLTSRAINDELAMELNRQRAVTQTVIQSGQVLTERLKELGTRLEQLKESAKHNAELQKEVDAIKGQINALEAALPTHQPHTETKW